jgi:hypothetical protein
LRIHFLYLPAHLGVSPFYGSSGEGARYTPSDICYRQISFSPKKTEAGPPYPRKRGCNDAVLGKVFPEPGVERG